MAPDPEQYRFYHRKDVSGDMVDEVPAFFRHAVENNVPVPELISADYSFVNADQRRFITSRMFRRTPSCASMPSPTAVVVACLA